jgi:hypothetical protein
VLYVYMAVTAAEVAFPSGESIEDVEGSPEIRLLDANRRIIAVFQRSDVSLYSRHPLPRSCLGGAGGLEATGEHREQA